MKSTGRTLLFFPLLAAFILLPALLTIPPGCKKEEPVYYVAPVVYDLVITRVTTTSIEAQGHVGSDYNIPIDSRGVCWNTTGNPTIADNPLASGKGLGEFTATITGLTPTSYYYLRAYTVSAAGTIYGPVAPVHTFSGTVKDIDNNSYGTIVIGKREWMGENLKTTHLNDGTLIPFVDNMINWITRMMPAYCYNGNLQEYGEAYGPLYNAYSALSGRLCPSGWHVPTLLDWKELERSQGDTTTAGSKLKEAGTGHWSPENKDATNESGFTGLPGGRYGFFSGGGGGGCDAPADWSFSAPGSEANWWSVTPVAGDTTLFSAFLYLGDPKLLIYTSPKMNALSVRCIKD
jgi:uncharacterized protein (TIGR02145 family)